MADDAADVIGCAYDFIVFVLCTDDQFAAVRRAVNGSIVLPSYAAEVLGVVTSRFEVGVTVGVGDCSALGVMSRYAADELIAGDCGLVREADAVVRAALVAVDCPRIRAYYAADVGFAADFAFVDEVARAGDCAGVGTRDAADEFFTVDYRGEGVGEVFEDSGLLFVLLFVCADEAADVLAAGYDARVASAVYRAAVDARDSADVALSFLIISVTVSCAVSRNARRVYGVAHISIIGSRDAADVVLAHDYAFVVEAGHVSVVEADYAADVFIHVVGVRAAAAVGDACAVEQVGFAFVDADCAADAEYAPLVRRYGAVRGDEVVFRGLALFYFEVAVVVYLRAYQAAFCVDARDAARCDVRAACDYYVGRVGAFYLAFVDSDDAARGSVDALSYRVITVALRFDVVAERRDAGDDAALVDASYRARAVRAREVRGVDAEVADGRGTVASRDLVIFRG